MLPQDEQLRAEWLRHLRIVLLAIGVFVLAAALEVREDEKVALQLLPSLPAPETCPSRTCFHLDCPACGLTRSFVKLAAGDIAGSVQKHRLGWLVALFVAGQVPFRIALMQAISRTGQRRSIGDWPQWFTVSVLVAVLANWLLKLCGW